MRPFKVLRAIIGPGILEPAKCSANQQIAINSSNHITIIEPKLPFIHHCIEPPGSEGKSSTIDPATFFEIRSVFHVENLESLGFQVFSRILITDSEKMFNLGRISEPIIVGHAWSPIESCTRDCYLGVLLNTGEMMVLKRDSLDATNYSVKFRSFTSILDQMSLPQNRLTAEGDIVLTGEQYLELKITDFLFGRIADGSLVLALAHESGFITIHALTESLPLLQRFETRGLVVKLLWSSLGTELYYALSDNSVWGCKFDPKLEIQGDPIKVKDASRFLVSHLHLVASTNTLVVTDTRAVYVGGINSPWVSCNLPYNSVVVNISAIAKPSGFTVLLPFESGRFCAAEVDTSRNTVKIVKDSPGWESFHNETLYNYQVVLSKEQNKALSKVFQPYLAETPEGHLVIHGFLPMLSNGLAAVVYSLSPKNVISHNIKSRREFNMGFIPVSSISSFQVPESTLGVTALSYLNSLIIADKEKIPVITKEVKDGDQKALQQFVESLKEWKASRFDNPALIKLSVSPTPFLEESIILNFRENKQIDALQKLFLLNISLTKTMHAIKSNSNKPYDALNQELMVIASEQDLISSKIRTHLASIVVFWASEQSISSFDSTLDTFLLNTYRVVLLHSNMALAELPIPERVKLTISTDLCTEMFEISKQEVISSLKTVMSSSNHSWPRCDMTLLPILDLNNKMDELESHNYLSTKRDESYILRIVFGCLNYCIFTGTRTFDLKIGV